jgi:hypothetical protein
MCVIIPLRSLRLMIDLTSSVHDFDRCATAQQKVIEEGVDIHEEHANLRSLRRAAGALRDPQGTCLRGTRTKIVEDIIQFAPDCDPKSVERI